MPGSQGQRPRCNFIDRRVIPRSDNVFFNRPISVFEAVLRAFLSRDVFSSLSMVYPSRGVTSLITRRTYKLFIRGCRPAVNCDASRQRAVNSNSWRAPSDRMLSCSCLGAVDDRRLTGLGLKDYILRPQTRYKFRNFVGRGIKLRRGDEILIHCKAHFMAKFS